MATDILVSALDEKYNKDWDMYRAALGFWCVKLTKGSHKVSVGGRTIEAALDAALSYVWLPEIPRCPRVLSLDLFEARKSGSKWELYYDGQFHCGNISTKKNALDAANKTVGRYEKAREEWHQMYGVIANGVEGVDYRYAL